METVKKKNWQISIACAKCWESSSTSKAHLGVSVVCNTPARVTELVMNLTRSYWQAHSEPRDSEAAVLQWTIVWTQSQEPTETLVRTH